MRLVGKTKKQIEEENQQRLLQAKMVELKQFLVNTDYVTIKIAEGVASREDYEEVLEQRNNARNEINRIKKLLGEE